MKILGIIAGESPAEPAARLAWLLLDQMKDAGMEVEALYIGSRAELPLCRGADGPASTEETCADFMSGVMDRLEACDGFFLAAPVIAGNLASAMAAFLERLALLGAARSHFLRGKVGGMFVAGGHIGGMQAIYQVVNFFYTTEAIFTWTRYWPMSWENEGVDRPEDDEEAVETINDLAQQMIWMLKVLA